MPKRGFDPTSVVRVRDRAEADKLAKEGNVNESWTTDMFMRVCNAFEPGTPVEIITDAGVIVITGKFTIVQGTVILNGEYKRGQDIEV